MRARSGGKAAAEPSDRKSTRLNSSHMSISYAVFCLKKKNNARAHHLLQHRQEQYFIPVLRLTLGINHAFDCILECCFADIEQRQNFFFNDAATTEIYTLSLHDALPI